MQETNLLRSSPDDIEKTMQGLLALAQHLKCKEEVAISLALFRARSASVRKGEIAEYAFKLVNNSKEHLWLGLLVGIYPRENPVHPQGHHAYFRKEIFVPSRSSQELAFHYNWRDSAAFIIDAIPFAPDSGWFGPYDEPARYLVCARLYGADAEPIEELPLLQRLL